MKEYLSADNVELVYSGNNYFELLEELIDKSKEVIHFQTYIFETDETGMRIIEALKRAATRNVSVYLMIDAFGSNTFSHEVIKELGLSGIHFRKYSPLFSSESIFFGRRLHYKIIVCDKKASITGGINIADKYNNTDESPWLDYAILTKGGICEYLHILCERVYKKQNSSALTQWVQANRANQGSRQNLVGFRLNDWIKGKNEIYESYISEIKKAQTSITIISSYFLPGPSFRRLLAQAVKRGVTVKIILAGKSDVRSVRLAENYLYAFYFRNKIQLYEWSNSVMHGKAMIIDKRWSTIGSYNINFLSRYISIELNTDVLDIDFAGKFEEHVNGILHNGCKQVDPQQFREKSNWIYQIKIWLAYNFYRVLMDIVVNKRGRKLKTK